MIYFFKFRTPSISHFIQGFVDSNNRGCLLTAEADIHAEAQGLTNLKSKRTVQA